MIWLTVQPRDCNVCAILSRTALCGQTDSSSYIVGENATQRQRVTWCSENYTTTLSRLLRLFRLLQMVYLRDQSTPTTVDHIQIGAQVVNYTGHKIFVGVCRSFCRFFLYLSVISMFELDCVFIVRFLQRHILSEWQFPLQHFLRVTFDLVTFSPLYFVRDLINLWCILQHWYKWSFFMWRVPGHWNSFRSGLGRGNVRTPSIAVVFAISYGWDAVSGNLSKSACFEGVGHFERKFQTEGALPTKHCWCQKTRVIALSCGIKISAVHCLVLSQNTRVTDRRTDRITTPTTALTRSRGKIQYRYSYRRKYQPRICE